MHFKNSITLTIALILSLLSSATMAGYNLTFCKSVYTIGAYDEAFKKNAQITKFGPIPAAEVPAEFPPTFLESNGSYGGGEAFCTIMQACTALKDQVASGVLPTTENWHIYLLDARWKEDVYTLHPRDYRLKRSVPVVKLVKENCFK